jgi:hypothetical protein
MRGDPVAGPIPALLVVRTDIAPEQEEAFNRWYDEVHLPEIVEVPGVCSGRRYRLAEGDELFPGDGIPSYLAVYELDDAAAVRSPEFAERRGWGPFESHVANNKAAVYVLLKTELGGS